MKIYVYKPDEIKLDDKYRIVNPFLYGTGIENNYYVKMDKCRFYGSNYRWRDEWRNWGGYKYDNVFRFVNNIKNADFILIPYTLDELIQDAIDKNDISIVKEFLFSLPSWNEREDDHILLSFIGKDIKLGTSAIILKTGVNKNDKDINAFAWPYPIEDYNDIIHYSHSKIKYATNFVGCNMSHEVRNEMLSSFNPQQRLSSYIETYRDFFTTYYKDIKVIEEKRMSYLDTIVNSYTTLCPRGYGLTSIRFFETMMLGRVPVLIADDIELPFSKYINYKEFCIFVKEADAKNTYDIINEFFKLNDQDTIFNAGIRARNVWENYFKCHNWQYSLFTLLQEKMDNKSKPIYL